MGLGPEQLAFLDPPPRPALTEAKALLTELGAIDGDGRITDEGRKLRQLPLPPRLARMVVDAAEEGAALPAAEIAVLIGERGLAGDDVDLTHRLDALRRDRSPRAREARAMAERWAQTANHTLNQFPPDGGEISVGALLALAYPERIAKNRGGASGAFLLANGRGAQIDATSALAREPFLAVAELTGSAASGRILLAAPITLAEIEARFADRIVASEDITFDQASASLRVRRLQRLGAITLSEQPLPAVASDDAARTLPKASLALVSAGCRGPTRCANGATASCFSARRKEAVGPICPTSRLLPTWTGWPRSSPARLRSQNFRPTNSRPR